MQCTSCVAHIMSCNLYSSSAAPQNVYMMQCAMISKYVRLAYCIAYHDYLHSIPHACTFVNVCNISTFTLHIKNT